MGINANTNWGFRGEVTSAQTPLVLGRGVRYSVESPTALEVTIGGAGDRSVTVAAGTAWGDGVLSTWDTGAVLNGAAPSGTSTRWDTVVVRRTWQPASTPTGTASLVLLSGGTSQAIATSRTTDAGVTTSDQPIALVRFVGGQAATQQVIDLRAWAGAGGGLVAAHVAALDYLDDAGTQVSVGGRIFTRDLISGSPTWTRPGSGRLLGVYDGAFSALSAPGGGGDWRVWAMATQDIASVTIPDPGVPYRVQFEAHGEMGSESANARWDFHGRIGAVRLALLVSLGIDLGAGFKHIIGVPSSVTFTGSQTAYLTAYKIGAGGSAYGTITPYNRLIRVAVYEA